MIPVMQTKFSSEDGSTRGNCMAACVASLLEIDIQFVPAWEDMGDDGSWVDSFYSLLDSHGVELEGYYEISDDLHWDMLIEKSKGIDGYFIVGGSSPRQWVTRGHAVIYKDGVLAHDPHPSGAGLVEVKEVYVIERRCFV